MAFSRAWDLNKLDDLHPATSGPKSLTSARQSTSIVQSIRMALSAYAILKLLLLLTSGIANQIAMTPPNPPAKKIVKPNFFERNVRPIVKMVIVSASPTHHIIILNYATSIPSGLRL